MANNVPKLKKIGWILSAAAGLSLVLCTGAAARAPQEQEQGQQEQQDGQQDQGPPPKGRPAYTPQEADRPPYSRDREMRDAPSWKHLSKHTNNQQFHHHRQHQQYHPSHHHHQDTTLPRWLPHLWLAPLFPMPSKHYVSAEH